MNNLTENSHTPEEILDFLEKNGGIFNLNPIHFSDRFMTFEEMKKILKLLKCLYLCEDQEEKFDVILTGGFYSNGYINFEKILRYPKIVKLFAHEILKKIVETHTGDDKKIDVVFGTSTLGDYVSHLIAEKYNSEIQFIPLKTEESGSFMPLGNLNIEGKKSLIVGDYINSKDIVEKIKGAIEGQNKIEISGIYFSINRSKQNYYSGIGKVISNFDFYLRKKTEPMEYPALNPKEKENWEKLGLEL